MNVWDAALKKGSFQHTRATRRWSSATYGVQNVLLVHGHTTLDVDATVWWPGRWSRGQTTATLEETFSRHLFLARSRRRINAIPHSWRRSPDLSDWRVAVVWPRDRRPGHQTVASTSTVVCLWTRRTFWTPDVAELHLLVALVCWKLPFYSAASQTFIKVTNSPTFPNGDRIWWWYGYCCRF